MLDAPLHLTPRLVDKPWGGDRLGGLGRDVAPGARVGESWEVADLTPAQTALPDPVTRVAAGEHAGRTLAELVAERPTELLGDGVAVPADGRFPLLVKLLDAREPLSVQVHPPADWPTDDVDVKTESWVVVAAEPDAVLHLGLADGTTPAQVRRHAGTPAVTSLLRQVPARTGDVFHLPAGTVHALGAGVLVAEVQTPSDTTFRFYDWTQELGRVPRELHLQDALAAMELAWGHNLADPVRPRGQGRLVTTDAYTLDRHELPAGAAAPLEPGRAHVLVVLEGGLRGGGLHHPLERAGVVLLPAACASRPVADGPTTLLVATPT